MEGIIRLLLALFFLLTGTRQPAEPSVAQGPGSHMIHSATLIDSVEAIILESYPAQIRLTVSGSQPDGCDYPVQVEQHRDGNVITVDIYREVPPSAICPMMLRYYNETIALEGTFESGTYTIHVNDYTLEVTI